MGDFVGGHDLRRTACVVAKNGDVTFELHVAPDETLAIEFEEIDGRSSGVRGYQVLVDDRPVYFRTWRGCGAGPVHFFVQLPATKRDRVTVRLVNQSAAKFAIGRVWAWGDFETSFDANRLAVPYYLAPTVPLGGDLAEDREKLRQVKSSFGKHANIQPAWTTWIAYAGQKDDGFERIDEALKLAEEFDLPVQICFDSWWSNTPTGSDGKGGHWNDEKYQQLVWNESRRRMELSIPNRWSSTPWLTMNDPDLNAFKMKRLAACAAHLREQMPDLQARSKRQLLLAINLENEPIYWASGNAGLGDDLLWADFNPRAVAAAKADGVTLDPKDGLSRDERLWLWKNLLHYNDLVAATVVQALGSSGDSLADDVYTQAMMMASPDAQFPMQDCAYSLWEAGAPASCRVGGEWNVAADSQRESIEHQLPLGRCAAVNAECENDAAHHLGVAPAYALGQRFYTPYNYPLDQMNVAASDVDDLAKPLTPLLSEPALSECTFDDDAWKKQVVSSDGLVSKRLGNTTLTAVCPATPATVAQLTYRVDCSAALDGLAVEIAGRVHDFRGLDPAVQIRVLAGDADDPAKLREITVLLEMEDLNAVHRVDLSDAARGRKELFVRLELRAPTLPPEVMEWCCVHRVRFTKAWPKALVDELPAQDLSMRLARKEHLLVSWRADAERAMARSNGEALEQAKAAYANGQYAAAYRLANASKTTSTTQP